MNFTNTIILCSFIHYFCVVIYLVVLSTIFKITSDFEPYKDTIVFTDNLSINYITNKEPS